MRFVAHEYQRRAIAWVVEHRRCALFLEMGLGKTVAALTAFARLQDLCEAETALVIAPKTVAEGTWARECAKWEHLRHLRVSVATGGAAQRRKALAADADIYVVSRDNVVWLVNEQGGRLPYSVVIVDELTSFKSHGSKRFKALRLGTADTERVVGLTGTPAPNGLLDLWAQLCIIDRGRRLGRSFTAFRRDNFHCIEHNHIVIKAVPKAGTAEAIREALGDICLSMEAKDWLSLPPMVEVDEAVELGKEAMEGYRRFQRERIAEIEGQEVTADTAAALCGKLAQWAGGAVYGEEGEAWAVTHTAKVERLRELIEGLRAQGESALVFYQYRHERERILAAVPDAECYGGPSTLERWNKGEIAVLLAHPASTAYGLNMQEGGRYVVWFTLGWNLEQYQQANARLHRQGQARPVTVYRLISAGTVDERAALALAGKGDAQAAVMEMLKDN